MEERLTYGGQAVLEGVMIRGRKNMVVAVRLPDGDIALRLEPIAPVFTGNLRRVPLLRGVLTLAETLILGMKALAYSANAASGDDGQEVSQGSVLAMVFFSAIFAVGIFFLLPVFVVDLLDMDSSVASNLVEGVIRLGIFVGYIILIGRMKDISRVFMYHGAEHMTVHAQERGVALTLEGVRRFPTAHPRCGTSFLLTVMLVSILVFAFTGREPLWWLLLSRVVLIPVIAAISYEVIRYGGFHMRNPLVQLLAGPSLALQALTTRPPEDEHIEVAIAAMGAAIKADRGEPVEERLPGAAARRPEEAAPGEAGEGAQEPSPAQEEEPAPRRQWPGSG